MLPPVARLLTVASFAICLIVSVSFAVFAVDQAKGASNRQQQALIEQPAATGAAARASTGESSLHEAIDEAARILTAPFAGLISGTSSQWAIRAAKLLLALLVYGFGLGYLARRIRVRV